MENNVIALVAILLLVSLVVLFVIVAEGRNNRRYHHGRRRFRPHHWFPWRRAVQTHLVKPYCAHTRWGCCPDGRPKNDSWGTNC
jgi:hypothetical protein